MAVNSQAQASLYKRMEFPVDVLEATSHGELERSAHSYMNKLLYTDPDHAHHFTLPNGKKVQISLSNVGFVPLHGANLQHKVLALFAPQDQLTAVALFLANQWYSVEDILKTADSMREGLVKVRSVGERIVLYALNRIVYRTKEMASGEMPFLCHSENDYAKILWKNGQAVGFYSVKPKGSVCNNFLKQCYFLPVMDSIFVRKTHRGKGYGLQMLEDFVDSFNEDELGLKYPLSPAMTSVCRHYLDRYPADVDLLWEVEGVGGPYQRTRVAFKLCSSLLNDTHKDGQGEDNGQNGDIMEDEVEESEDTSLNLTEEIIVLNKHHKITEEIDTPISMRTRSSEHKRRKRVRDEVEAKGVDSQPEKINRMEITDEEKTEFIPADDVVAESVPEAPTETLAVGVNGKQAEEKEEVKDGVADEDESAIENCTGSKEEEKMEVEEESGKHKAPVQEAVHKQTVNTLEDPASEQEGNQKMEIYTVAYVQQKEKDAAAAEEVGVAENEQELLVDTQLAPASAAREKQEVAPAAQEKQEVAPANEEELIAPVSEEEEEEQGRVPAVEEEQEKAPATEQEKEGAPTAEEKQDKAAVAVEEEEGAPPFQQEVAPELEKSVDPAADEEQDASESDDNEIATEVEKQDVDFPSEETSSSLATDAEGEQGLEDAMDVLNAFEVPDISEEPSGEKVKNTLIVEEQETAQKDDEMDEEGEENDFSKVFRGARTKAVYPASKRASKRLCKMTIEEGEEDQAEEKVVEEDRGMSTEEEKVTTEEEAENSSEEDEQVQDPPVIDKRVLRRKTRVIQTKQRTRSKRRSKI